jgi:signal transduction histidine kinase
MQKFLGDILLEKGYITTEELDRALTCQTARIFGKRPAAGWVTAFLLEIARTKYNHREDYLLGKILTEMKLLPETRVEEALEIQRSTPLVRPRSRLAALSQVTQRLNSSFNLIDLLQQILVLAADVAGAQSASLIIHDRAKQALVILMPTGPRAEELRDLEIPMDQGIVGWVYRTATSAVVNDTSADPRFFPGIDAKVGFTSRQILCVPLTVKGRRLGAVEVINKTGIGAGKTDGFTEADLSLLEMFSAQAAIAIENTRLAVELSRAESDFRIQKESIAAAARSRGGALVARALLARMRNSLAPLRGYAQRLREVTTDVRAEKYGGYIDRELERVMSAAADMVRFFSGRYGLRPERLDLKDLFAELEARTWVDVRVWGISFSASAPPGLAVQADRELILKALDLVFRNSCEAMPGGGGFSLLASAAGSEVLIEVRDSGSGIPSGMEEKIFEPFFTDGKQHAAGLGLAIVRSIVEAHGGSVTGRSCPDRGACLALILPRGREPILPGP